MIFGQWLDVTILEIVSNLNDCVGTPGMALQQLPHRQTCSPKRQVNRPVKQILNHRKEKGFAQDNFVPWWGWWEWSNMAAAKHELQLNVVNMIFSNVPEHQSGSKLIPLFFPKLLPRGEFWSTPWAEILNTCSGWKRNSKTLTRAEGLVSSTQGTQTCEDLLCSHYSPTDPGKGTGKYTS